MTSDLKMPTFRLDGQTALVTGAGRGLGAAIAESYAACGAEVLLLGRTRSHLDEVAQAIDAAGGKSRVVTCDVTDDGALRAAIAGLSTLDILVNNAGTNFPEPFVEVSDDHLDTMLDLNVRACFVAAQAAVKKMLAGEAIRNYESWTAEGMPDGRLMTKLKDYARNMKLDGEAKSGKQAVHIGRVQDWSDNADEHTGGEGHGEGEREEVYALGGVKCYICNKEGHVATNCPRRGKGT